MKKLDEISINAKQLYEDLKDLEQFSKKEKLNDIDFNYFRGAAKHNAFNEHILKNENEYIQRNYLYLISSLLMFNNKEEVKNSQFLYIARLVAGFSNKNLDIENIYSNTMIMDGKQISDCIEAIKEYKDVFVVDSLICANIEGKANDEVLEYLSEIYFMMGVKYNEFNELLNLCNAILENSSERICKIEIRTIGRYRHHINKMFKEKVFYDLEDISKDEKGDILLLNYTLDMQYKNFKSNMDIRYSDCSGYLDDYKNNTDNIVQHNEKFNINRHYHFNVSTINDLSLNEGYINFDKYSFNRIKLVNCKFNGIIGMKSNKKRLEFINCIIENMKNHFFYYKEEYIIRERIIPINLSNSNFIKCKIKLCGVDKENTLYFGENKYFMMKFKKCEFEDVEFINCTFYRWYGVMLYLEDSRISRCLFLENKCFSNTNMIEIKNSEIIENTFKKCKLLDVSNDNSIISSDNSKILNNIFTECYGEKSNRFTGKGKVTGQVLNLDCKSKEKGNKFLKCNFEEYVKNK